MEGNIGEVRPPVSLTLQEGVIAAGMLYGKPSVTSYELVGGERYHKSDFSQNEFDALTKEFQQDPFTRLAYGRQNLLEIMKDEKLPEEKKQDRVRRYVDAFHNLIPKIDRDAFPPDEKAHKGIPSYIPDGLSDMGSDPNVEAKRRSREKIRVNKEDVFKQNKDFFYEIYSQKIKPGTTLEQWKKWVTQRVAHYVYTSMPYNSDIKMPDELKSVNLVDIKDRNLAVCRHHALMTEVLLQSFGITSRLMKTDLIINGKNLGPHVNNAVRIEGKWYIIDSTNPEPESDGKTRKIFFRPIPEASLDLNGRDYQWDFTLADGESRGYKTRSNMYFRVMDNKKPL